MIDHLNLIPFGEEMKTVQTVNRPKERVMVAKVRLELESIDGSVKRREELMTSQDLFLGSKVTDWTTQKRKWQHLQRVWFRKLANREEHDLLIGADLVFYHRCLREVKAQMNAPIARLTPCGWTCFELVQRRRYEQRGASFNHCTIQELSELVKQQ